MQENTLTVAERQALVTGESLSWASRLARSQSIRTPVAYDDLLSVAYEALTECTTLFDPTRGVKFVTYATYRIRRRLLEAVTDTYKHTHNRKDGDNEDTTDYIDTLPAPQTSFSDRSDAIALIESLPPQERQVITLRYIDGKTGDETGEIMGVTRARVSQIEKKALSTLRALIAA